MRFNKFTQLIYLFVTIMLLYQGKYCESVQSEKCAVLYYAWVTVTNVSIFSICNQRRKMCECDVSRVSRLLFIANCWMFVSIFSYIIKDIYAFFASWLALASTRPTRRYSCRHDMLDKNVMLTASLSSKLIFFVYHIGSI